MSGVILKLIVYVAIFAIIYFGIRKIWRDWTGHFKTVDEGKRQRDLKERERPDVITLKRDKDGTFRPGDDS